jgi:hypothetical protein
MTAIRIVEALWESPRACGRKETRKLHDVGDISLARLNGTPASKTEIQRASVEIPEVEYRVRVSFESFDRIARNPKRNRERGDAETPAPPSTSDFPTGETRQRCRMLRASLSRISKFQELPVKIPRLPDPGPN